MNPTERTEPLGGYLVTVAREEIEAQRFHRFLLEALTGLVATGAEDFAAIQERLKFAVHGYDDDPRDMYEIQEIKAFFRHLDEMTPQFSFGNRLNAVELSRR